MPNQHDRIPLANRFWQYVDKTDGCWLWRGTVDDGYGVIHEDRPSNRVLKAHRVSYEWANGPIAKGKHLHHLCGNRLCVRPDHLSPIAPADHSRQHENTPPMQNAVKTHCLRGHPLSGDNLAISRGWRRCKQCHRDDENARYHRKHAEGR